MDIFISIILLLCIALLSLLIITMIDKLTNNCIKRILSFARQSKKVTIKKKK